MPLFFFDLHDAGCLSRDVGGTTFPNEEMARRAAVELLPNLARDKPPHTDGYDLVTDVRDEAGQFVFTATLSLVTRRIH